MRGPLHLRPLTAEEERVISKLARSQSASKRLVERAKIIQLAKEGQTIPRLCSSRICRNRGCASGGSGSSSKGWPA